MPNTRSRCCRSGVVSTVRREGDPDRTAVDIVQGLEVTWRIIEDRLMRGSPADALVHGELEVVRTVWGLLDHDLPHAGQLSLLLRAIGMPGVDI